MPIESIRMDFMKPLYQNQHYTRVPLVPSYDLDDLFDLYLEWNDAVEYFVAYDYPTELYLGIIYDGNCCKTIRLTTSEKIQLIGLLLDQCKAFIGGDVNADSSKTKERRHNTVEGNAKKTSGGAKKVQKRRKSRRIHS